MKDIATHKKTRGKPFNYQRTGALLVIISGFSRLFGFVREVLMTKYFGSSAETDAFFFAVTMSNFFSIYLVSAVSQTFIPVLSEVDANESADTNRFCNNVIHVLLLISIAFLILATVFIRPLTVFFTRGIARNSPESFEFTVKLSRITMISILIPGLVGVFSRYLQYNRRFLSPAMIGIPLNASYLLYFVLFADKHGIVGLTWASVLSGLAQLLFLIPSLRRSNFKYVAVLDLKDPYVKRMVKLSIPVIFSNIFSEAGNIMDKSLATWLPTGSVTYLTYSGLIHSTIMAIFISSMSVMIFPAMAQAFVRKHLDCAHRYLSQAYRATAIITIPMAIYVCFFAKDIVAILFQRGLFDSRDTLNTAKIVSVYALGLPVFSFMRITVNAYHANRDMRSPAKYSILQLILNVFFTLIFIKYIGVSGIALASVISSIIITSRLTFLLGIKHNYKLANRIFMATIIKVFLASVICLMFMLFAKYICQNVILSRWHGNILFIALSLLTFLLYVSLGVLLRINEIQLLVGSVKKKIFSLKKCDKFRA